MIFRKTNDNGRLEFIQQLLPGQYKLRFDIKPYFDQLNTSSLFPFIDVSNWTKVIFSLFLFLIPSSGPGKDITKSYY